jgi:acylphosphatase
VDPVVRWKCIAVGKVQGVNYRRRVAETARRHGVVGSVANRPDGSVLIEVQGPLGTVETFVEEVSGPWGLSDAHAVRRVADLAPSPDLVGFSILRS